MGIKDMMNKWYDNLSEQDKLDIVQRFNELMEEEGMILVGGEGTLKPDHELPHGPENAIKKRERENKEKKISDKCKARAVAEAFRDHLSG
jgi:hypothetical protein